MVSGRYFFPNAPVLCLKWMPAWAVTSVNSIGPEGRAGAALGAGVGWQRGTGVGSAGSEPAARLWRRAFLMLGSPLLAPSQCQESEESYTTSDRHSRHQKFSLPSANHVGTAALGCPVGAKLDDVFGTYQKLVELRSTGQPRAAVPTWFAAKTQCAAASFSALARRESSQISISIAVGPTMNSA